jgi:hypothetical protein
MRSLVPKLPRNAPLADRFANLASPEPNSGCWIWLGAVTKSGYGIIRIDGKTKLATHLSLELNGFPRSGSDFALHSCDTPSCVNPDHLRWGSQQENMADMEDRTGHWNARKTHCKHGHEYTAENTIVCKGHNGNPKRNCRKCQEIRSQKRRMRSLTLSGVTSKE